MKISVYDCESNIEIIRDATDEEIAANENASIEHRKKELEASDKATIRAQIFEKLGLTQDEVAILLG